MKIYIELIIFISYYLAILYNHLEPLILYNTACLFLRLFNHYIPFILSRFSCLWYRIRLHLCLAFAFNLCKINR